MNRWLILAEGESAGRLAPIDLVRPAFMLRHGAWTFADRWAELLHPTTVLGGVRPWLASSLAEETGWTVNRLPSAKPPDDVWIIIGAVAPTVDPRWDRLEFPAEFRWSDAVTRMMRVSGSSWKAVARSVSAWLENGATGPRTFLPQIAPLALPVCAVTAPWDLITQLGSILSFDWVLWSNRRGATTDPIADPDHGVFVANPSAVWRGGNVRIDPHVFIDARHGPVWLDDGVVVESFTRIDGPAYIGKGTRLLGGKITGGCAIGPGCRIGGEWEAAIAQAFSNKAHAGFFGHGYLGEWVNLGAMTTNSDLKNTYGTVRVERGHGPEDTGQIKVGSYLADHTKTGIGTLLPTGSTWGVGANIFAGGWGPKLVPSFVWGGDQYTEHRLDRMLQTADIAISRRAEILQGLGRPGRLTDAQRELLQSVFERSATERRDFLTAQGSHP
ncbi:MAG: hypothetical protein HY304_03420 [candidate division Zixibacteria bacterium]|nr:hypothetical protein [candidate division Zixibacteria bacterium]